MLFLKYIIKQIRLIKQCIDSCVICYDILKLVIIKLNIFNRIKYHPVNTL